MPNRGVGRVDVRRKAHAGRSSKCYVAEDLINFFGMASTHPNVSSFGDK